MPHTIRFARSSFALAAALAAQSAFAQSVVVTRPDITTASGPETRTLNGVTFTNQGLVGAGRLDARTRDFNGDTLGSFSGAAINLATWRRNANGGYSAVLYTLPDRGPNDVGNVVGTVNYFGRLHISNITFNPGNASTNLPQATASQNQVTITPTGGFLLKDANGANFTGRDPGTGTITRGGIVYPSPASGPGAGLISLDAEAVAFRRDGSFYISDEYAASIYYFGADGRQIGAIQTVPALLPVTAGATNFNSVAAPTSGRRNNQGLEGMTISPTGNRLITVLQSATVQDTNGSNQQTRNNTRVLVYDISSNATPARPVGHYVLQLPTFTQAGSGAAVNRTAAQSEILALNDNQFLVLARDGIGRGAGDSATNSPVYKSVLLVDTTGATNLAGTQFETSAAPIATNGVLNSTITPVQQIQLVNLLNPVQLGRFGMNLNTAPSSATSLSEKQEAMALVPVLEEGKPQDFFLFIGNDNDFQASNGSSAGISYDASLSGAGGSGNNDSVLLVYRLTLPTYVDPEALFALNTTTPGAIVAATSVANDIGRVGNQAALGWLSSLRSVNDGGYGTGPQIWTGLDWNRTSATFTGGRLRADGLSVSGGVDYGFGVARIGASVGYRSADGNFGAGTLIKGTGLSFGAYAAVMPIEGLYLEVAGSKSADLKLDAVSRVAAYGQTATGETEGESWGVSGEIGYLLPLGSVSIGPVVRLDYVDTELDGYTETGASLSNAEIPGLSSERLRVNFGLEGNYKAKDITLTLRGGYGIDEERAAQTATVRLASAQHINGTTTLVLPDTERDVVFGGGRIDGKIGPVTVRAAGEGRFGRGEDEARVTVGIGIGF